MEIKRLKDWMTFLEVQQELGYKTRMGVWSLVFDSRVFDEKDLAYIPIATQVIYLVRTSAVLEWKARREELAHQQQLQREQAEAAKAVHIETVTARRRMRTLLGEQGIKGKQERIDYVSAALGRDVDDWYTLDLADANKVIASLTAQ